VYVYMYVYEYEYILVVCTSADRPGKSFLGPVNHLREPVRHCP
jgi:hypothetical protein